MKHTLVFAVVAVLVAGCDTPVDPGPVLPLTIGEGCTQGSDVTRNAVTRTAVVHLRLTTSKVQSVADSRGVLHQQTVLGCKTATCSFTSSLYGQTDGALIDFCEATVA